MPLQATSGAASYDAFGGGVPVEPNYIESCFQTWLYTGTGATQAINNGIDLSTKGGLVWIKDRDGAGYASHYLADTVRTRDWRLSSDSTASQYSIPAGYDLTSFNANGFSVGIPYTTGVNNSGDRIASWTFRKQPKFFDVVTYTGDGTSSQAIPHNLGSTPGCIIIKPLQSASFNDWRVWHRSLTSQSYQLKLNTTEAEANVGNFIGQNSTTFTIGFTGANQSGIQYVAYLWAHDAGGFGLTGTDNVISCGSYTGNGTAGNAVTLGFEPQWIMTKLASSAGGGWFIQDVMRGMSNTGSVALSAQTSNAEADYGASTIIPTATGFTLPSFGGWNGSGETFIYIAIRRGPMKVPTTGTSVYNALLITGNGANRTVTGVGFPTDLFHSKARNIGFANSFYDRLRGATKELVPNSTAIENTDATSLTGFDVQDGVRLGTDSVGNATVNYPGGYDYVEHYFRRAPSFFDEVCYTGNSTPTAYTHNLGAVPELMIVKRRSGSEAGGIVGYWIVYAAASGNANALFLNTTDGNNGTSVWNSTTPTSTTFTVNDNYVNYSGDKYVAYLFATCAGVSKVGGYTGTGATQTIDCGFTGGARFVLVKRTNSTGDWYVWDTARGMVAGTDPSLLLNSTAAEVNANSIYTITSGFQIVSTAAGINASGSTYIFLAIA